MLYKVVPTFESVDEILKCDHSNESYSEQYFPVVLFIMLYKVVLSLWIESIRVTIQMSSAILEFIEEVKWLALDHK